MLTAAIYWLLLPQLLRMYICNVLLLLLLAVAAAAAAPAAAVAPASLSFPATRCKYSTSSKTWSCPPKREGLIKNKIRANELQNSPALVSPAGGVTGVVRYLNDSGYQLIVTASSGGITRNVSSHTYTWRDTPRGLQVNSQQQYQGPSTCAAAT